MEVVRFMDLQKNNVIKKRDFERYEIILPFSALGGRRKKQFLCSELEKMHPCFSDEFTFDSSLKSVRRNGLKENVFVMNKYKLAEYEGKRHFSGSGFYIEDSGKHFRRKLFVNQKWKLTVGGCFLCMLLGLAGCLSGALAGGKASYAPVVTEKIVDAESLECIECPLEPVFFDTVSKAGGKISRFEWKQNGFNQRLSASVKGVFPEMFPEFFNDFSEGNLNGTSGRDGKNIVYENGIPQMSVSFTKRISLHQEADNQISSASSASSDSSVSENAEFNKCLRELVFSAGAGLKEERIRPYYIEFTCPASGKKTEMLFKKLAEKISEKKKSVTGVTVSQAGAGADGEGELQIGLSVDDVPFQSSSHSGFDLSLIANNLPLFFDESIYRNSVKRRYAEQVPATEPQRTRNKIGEIRKPDKKVVVFYKNTEGKLEVEK